MKHVRVLIIKFVASLAFLYIILGLIYGMTFGEVLFLSAVLGVAAYLIGDMLILPRTNNVVATIADFLLAWLIIYWFADGMTVDGNVYRASLIAATGVGLFEIFFHRYLANNIQHRDQESSISD
ncbi:YndM family protein [Thermoactinomyces mirandus]|uniref:YndM family protein n=1 Tax=Thermoactinomyces mirandus TaxID=2756294 RepID=UPI001FEAD29F|nr:YndM family protein [Thermoactinomyces mirandus]